MLLCQFTNVPVGFSFQAHTCSVCREQTEHENRGLEQSLSVHDDLSSIRPTGVKRVLLVFEESEIVGGRRHAPGVAREQGSDAPPAQSSVRNEAAFAGLPHAK